MMRTGMVIVHKLRTNITLLVLTCTVMMIAGCQESATPTAQSPENDNRTELAEHPLEDYAPWSQQSEQNPHPPVLTVQTASQTRMQAAHQENPVRNSRNPLGESVHTAASGTPEWDIQQIAMILSEAKQQAAAENSLKTIAEPNEAESRKIVALATHAISLTHNKPEKELVFQAAVHSLMDARLRLAVAGDQESLDAIYHDAASLAEKHPDSAAAATAAGTVVRLAREMAELGDRSSPWISEYVRQAKLFAANFSQEEARAIVQLTTAAEFCEKHQLILPAIECFTFIQQQFPNSPFNTRSEAALLRLNLIGKTLPLEGPGLDGKTVQLTDLQGTPVLVVFWSSRSDAFVEDIPLIKSLCQKSGCQLIGISMDTSAESVLSFSHQFQLPGQHIFYQDATLQGAAQPMARQFGIHQVPSYWLIDKNGKVLSTCVTREQLKSLATEGE